MQALRDFAPEPATGPVSEGDAARTALLLLAEDPQQQSIFAALIEGPAPERLGVMETTALISVVLAALQTHLKFERDKDGRYSLKLQHLSA